MDIQATREALSHQKRTFSISENEIYQFFPILWVIFAFLYPDAGTHWIRIRIHKTAKKWERKARKKELNP